MNTQNCVVRDGNMYYQCPACGTQRYIDLGAPSAPQILDLAASHICGRLIPTQRRGRD
jgi:hypothetical protein